MEDKPMKCGRFYDPYRGNGCFVSFRIAGGFLLVGVRWRWHFYRVSTDHKRRWYFGPFEVELPAAQRASKEGREDG